MSENNVCVSKKIFIFLLLKKILNTPLYTYVDIVTINIKNIQMAYTEIKVKLLHLQMVLNKVC